MRLAILGATGLVAQKFVVLLHKRSPWNITEVVASSSKYNQKYGSACIWQESLGPMPESMKHLSFCSVEEIEADVVVSFLPEAPAKVLETYCLSQGKLVFSNAAAFRMHPKVPILIPEINQGHLRLLNQQPFPGKIITNSNCCVSGIALALFPLQDFGIAQVHVVTLQSASGAGYPGVDSMDLLGNIVPYIPGEEEKITREILKILGTEDTPADFPISITVHRVPVVFGHMLTIHVIFQDSVEIEEIQHCYHKRNQDFPETYRLYDSPWHPQPRKDLSHDDMRVHIGPITYGGNHKTIKMNVLIHNLVRGAAGALLANINTFHSQYSGEYTCSQ
ncbi:Aspartate-semialdehyde dehydrogenase 2 [Chlamydia avium]|uniref:Aspartate-semialdehyde dehydrogenase n=2 Tax=Chlamydia avium TaxID=1457141 RepID=W8JGM8_9CHLA|nr:aspartate-semialdehyde dehydrogenase [Chlamydia avium]AHK63345.1 Aspartate-semialdehyde dehydrogenase [Chlamydia avium 10DC88]EPP36037.1 aspartate-semialdehyde dehydrogenase [Chlamydia psittaci 10_743_SC13]EPP38114.1 aspartate-semialdehyde dehydrogenase [Chlamydia avium]VVT42946.1 Aspartate-semialdehyde dehydrogenase 2 [Chlamydia avium]